MGNEFRQREVMAFFRAILSVSIVWAFAIQAADCSKPDDENFGYANGILISRLNKKRIIAAEQDLRSVKDSRIPDDYKAGILIDALVAKALGPDSHGQPAWRLDVKHIYAGADKLSSNKLIVKSPTIKNGGATLRVGNRYRIFVMDVGKFFIAEPGGFFFWKGTAIQIKPKLRR